MKNVKTIPVFVISTFGHCGIDWLHSLIDSHKEVLIIPPLSFFRKVDTLKKKKIYLENYLNPKIVTDIITKELFKKTEYKSYNILSKHENKSEFKKHINNYLIMEKEPNIEKRLFFAIHYAFAKINKINLDRIKIIVAHEHVPWQCYQYHKHFNSKFVFIVRDPRATIAGSLRGFQRHKNIPINFQIDINLSFIISAQKFFQKMSKKKILILKNEEMHKSLRPEMKKLCKWLGIKFNNSLLRSTFLGKKWIGESGYLSKVDLIKPYPRNYYKPANIEKRWRSFLDKNTILIIETIFEKIMIQNKYKFDNKLNITSRISAYFSLLFRFNEFKNVFSFILGFVKNVIRRNFIIFFPSLSRKIFDIS